ncbi:aldehyde dehydrogenase family protein [Coxiella-like endosymbiont of Rhipicephalus sanguineus]|uniref:aldehyde dehydrogenase family protein n=1 Tax=Coxiella-like endosymbiont of Rhipicephalus sanguineus TaxID=1955402 RepID=UPI0020409AC7|nr:aldehyde dehydrogenase family protein [Coxiella-like endosymbiont of Rhipicephalus sanguineus]
MFNEEIFGPVIALIRAKDKEEGIELANNSKFGLGVAVFTKNTTRGENIAARRFQAVVTVCHQHFCQI